MTGSIECTSLVLRIFTSLGVTQGPNVPYIANPQSLIDEAYLTQGHILKKGLDDSLVFFYPGYANQIQLPNPDFRLYGQGPLTVPIEEPHRSSVSIERVTRSASRRAARAKQRPPQPSPQPSPQPKPQPTTPPPGTWTSTEYMPRVTPGNAPGWDQPMYQQVASSLAWASASSGEWAIPAGTTNEDATSSSAGLCSLSRGVTLTQEMSELNIRVDDVEEAVHQYTESTQD
jgi:hypothetical protein